MKIYKKDSKGKIRFAEFKIKEDTYTVITGIEGSEKSVSHSKTCISKNVGKSNETSSELQAKLELQAKYTKKLKEGYFKTIVEAKEELVILPMLAKDYNKEKDKIDWSNPVFCQPKLDGMRCLKSMNKMISRKNKPIDTLPHIMEDPHFIVDWMDGELYAHKLSFQENMKLIKKHRPESINVKYHVYDMVYPNLPFIDRYIILEKMVRNKEHIKIVPTFKVESLEEVQKYHTMFIEEGYEGTMIRHGNEGYAINKRSSQLLKYKDFIDEIYEIIDIIPSKTMYTHGTPVLKTKSNQIFKAGVKGDHKFREKLLVNKTNYIGKQAEIRFFEYTDSGLPRFPVFYGIRLDK